jgi:hypothetical protein
MKIRFGSASVLFFAMAILLCDIADGGEIIARLKVSAPSVDYIDVPVHAAIELPKRLAGVSLEKIKVRIRPLTDKFVNVSIPGQLVRNDKGKVEAWWVVPRLKANSTTEWTVDVPVPDRPNTGFGPVEAFSWQDKAGEYLDLLFDGKKVTRYMHAHDTSGEQRAFETYKPFHHVFDTSGNLVTNGPDGSRPYLKNEIRYPHHRGIFIGWNKLTFEGRRYDLWHMKEVHQVHQKFVGLIAGPVMARSTALIHWNAEDGLPMLVEHRRTTVYRQSDPTVVLFDVITEFRAVRGDVLLDGDPEHAGVQYRAHNNVAAGGKEGKAAYLFHQDGIDPKKDHDLPWVAMSYGLESGRYVVQHINHPDNPKPTIYSAYRDYGRFGAFFKKEIPQDTGLTLCYRIIVSRGDMPGRQRLAERYSVFVAGAKVEVLGQ